jgi:hypothetical protein
MEPAGATTTTGSTSRWATCTASATRAPTGLLHRARPRPQRPQAALPARQGAGGLLQHQRHDLHARPGARLRRLGRSCRRRQLALGHCLPTSSARGPLARCRLPWHGKGEKAANGASRSSACAGTSWTPLRPQRAAGRHPATDDFNRGNNEGVGYFEVNQKKGWRWNTSQGLPAPGARTRQPAGVDRRADRRAAGRTAAPWSAALHPRAGAGGGAAARARHARSDAVCRRRRHAAVAAALGHRPGRAAAPARHRPCSTICRAWAKTCRTTCRSARVRCRA